MGLPPLEYIDCFLDSPNFREIITLYEKELESNSQYVKSLVKECRNMISATEEFSKAQVAFAGALGNFSFQTIGEQTEDEKMIVNFLQTSSRLLYNIEDFRHNMLSTISVRLLQTLEKFRNDQIKKVKDEKRKYDRASQSYYNALEKHLGTSSKKREPALIEADSQLQIEHASYRQSAFQYVCMLQDVHSQKQYELIEPIIGYIGDVSTFLHQAYDSATSIKHEQQAVQFKVQILRETHENEQEKAYQLKAQIIEDGEAGLVHHPDFFRQGHLFIQDHTKKMFGGWHRYFCQFRKKDIAGKKIKQAKFTPIGHQGQIPTQDFTEVKECVRSKSEETDRRFCFEVELLTPPGIKRYMMQANTADDRKSWLEVMEGKEPVYTSLKVLEVAGVTPDMQGYDFVNKCLCVIEDRGLDEEGLYRKPGIVSRATKLLKECMEKGKLDKIDFTDELEWDTKTVSSAVKGYFNKHLGEPLLTFALHSQFIESAKILDRDKRVEAIRELVEQLPEHNLNILIILMEHLNRVAHHSDRNLMKASNLGVVFGPTLMRPERESVATIVNIKYQNIVVEEMIERKDMILAGLGRDSGGSNMSSSQKSRHSGSNQRPKDRSSTVTGPPIPGRESANKSPDSTEPGSSRRVPPGPPVIKSKTSVPDFQVKRRTQLLSDSNNNHKPMLAVKPTSVRDQTTPPTRPARDQTAPPTRPARRPRPPGRSARALYDCNAEDGLELSFKKNEILYNVLESEEPDWLKASRADGKKGLVPANYLELLS